MVWSRGMTRSVRLLAVALSGLVRVPSTLSARAEEISANVTVVMVLDNSGSMGPEPGWLGNDPDGVRFAAARMFIRLLDIGDRVAVVMFADDARESTGLVTIASEADREDVLAAVADRPAGGATNMNAAFERTASLLRQDSSGNRQYVLFLTDGWPELTNLKPGDPGFDAWWGQTLDFARAGGAPVLGVALNMTGGSMRYLEELVAVTGGAVFEADDSTLLAEAYLAVFGQLKGRTVLEPTTVPSNQDYRFEIPSLIQWVYFVAVSDGEPSATVSVDGSLVDADIWPDRRFVVIRSSPGDEERVPQGEWRVTLDEPATDVHAILISRFQVVVTAPLARVAPLGEPLLITAFLSEMGDDGSLVRLTPDAMELVARPPDGAIVDRHPMNDDGEAGDARANDGLYSLTFGNTSERGTYEYTVTAQREGTMTTASGSIELVPFPDIAIESPEARRYDVRGDDVLDVRVRITLEGEPFDLPGATVTAVLTGPDGIVEPVDMTEADGAYVGSLGIAERGDYSLLAEMEGVYEGTLAHARQEVAFEWREPPRRPTAPTVVLIVLLIGVYGAIRYLRRTRSQPAE
jgi:Mg-chelatase subunit ChlD